MALLFYNKTQCVICHQIIEEHQRIITFPPFVANKLDPLIIFNDGVVHFDCFNKHPLHKDAKLRLALIENAKKGGRICDCCHEKIAKPDDYFTVGFLTGKNDSPLAKYNFLQLHKSCINNFKEIQQLTDLLLELDNSGMWGGDTLKRLLKDIENSRLKVI